MKGRHISKKAQRRFIRKSKDLSGLTLSELCDIVSEFKLFASVQGTEIAIQRHPDVYRRVLKAQEILRQNVGHL